MRRPRCSAPFGIDMRDLTAALERRACARRYRRIIADHPANGRRLDTAYVE